MNSNEAENIKKVLDNFSLLFSNDSQNVQPNSKRLVPELRKVWSDF